MYQAFDIFGPPPPADDDFTLQRRSRDPDEGGGGGGIDDVLGWLGIPSPGGGRAGYGDDPSGGWWGATGLAPLDESGLGQLMMETDNDEAEYFDYSCLSSGLMSPDVESEFFGASCTARQLAPPVAAEQPYWAFNPSSATLPDRPPSPLFGDFRLPVATGSDASFPVVTSCDYVDDISFDSEARAKVKEIARYLASFEVQPWSASTQRPLTNSCSAPGSNPTSPFAELSSVSGATSSPNQPNPPSIASANKVNGGMSSTVGFFHAGLDDSNCGLETTMVNPNDVFPDRTDHQYASSRPIRDHPPRGRHTPRSSHRTSPQSIAPPRFRASSVLEALLRSTEPIDPNKGSGAAVALEGEEKEEGEAEHRVVGRRTPERMLKKLLTGRVARDDNLGLKGHRGQGEVSARVSAKRIVSPSSGRTTSGRAFSGFIEVELETDAREEFELSRELREIIRDQSVRQTNLNYSITPECFRCN